MTEKSQEISLDDIMAELLPDKKSSRNEEHNEMLELLRSLAEDAKKAEARDWR